MPHEQKWGKEGRESEVETERIFKKGDVRQVKQVLGQTRSWGEIVTPPEKRVGVRKEGTARWRLSEF